MKTSKTSLAAHITAMFVLSGCAAVSQPVYKVPEKNNCTDSGSQSCKKFDGVPYVLPRTTLNISLPVTATTSYEGSFVSEARKVFSKVHQCKWNADSESKCNEQIFNNLFSTEKKVSDKDLACISDVVDKADKIGLKVAINDAPGVPKVEYELNEATLTPRAEPDPSQLYYVEVKGGLFEKRSLNITYSDSGILNTIVLNKEDKTAEFIAKIFGSALGAAANVYGGRISDEKTTTKGCEKNSPYYNLVNRAMNTLDYIDNFQNKRDGVLHNETQGIGKYENLTLRLEEMDKKYETAKTVFEGTKIKTPKTYELTLLPGKIAEDKKNAEDKDVIHLAKFSQSCGLFQESKDHEPNKKMPSTNVPKMDKSCNADSVEIIAELSSPPHLTGSESSLSTRIYNSLDTSTNTRGIYYRVPETTRVSIQKKSPKNKAADQNKPAEYDVTDLLVKDVPISQYGRIASLPADTGSSNVTYTVTLDPVTGMLLSVGITSEATSAASTTAAQDAISAAGNYLISRDELTQLEREVKILEAKKKINEHKRTLGIE